MLNLKLKKLFLLTLFLIALPSLNRAQNKEDEPIKVNTFLVNIPVIATNKSGAYVSGLKKENFTIIQDGEKQPIEFFAGEEAPMNVAILIDSSTSTRKFIDSIQNAAWNFVKVFRSEDKGMIATFSINTQILTPLTADKDKLKKAIFQGKFLGGDSNMQDAIYQIVTKEFASVTGRKAIIVLTDGRVKGEIISNEKLLKTIAASDTLIYPILYDESNFFTKFTIADDEEMLVNDVRTTGKALRLKWEAEEKEQWEFIHSLGPVSGGSLFSSNDFKKSFQNIADELRKQYLIGYYPQNFDDGKSHKIMIEVNPSDISIRTKRNINLKPAP